MIKNTNVKVSIDIKDGTETTFKKVLELVKEYQVLD